VDIVDILFSATFWAATVRIACPLLAGVLNLGIEGTMTAGAMSGWLWVYSGGDLWSGVVFAACVGAGIGLLLAVFAVWLGVSQHVAGIGITLLASSVSYYVIKMLLPESTTPPKITPFQNWSVPYLSELPGVGQALFQHTPLTYFASGFSAAGGRGKA